MAAPSSNTDLTEEDAADLQFPKDDGLVTTNKITADCINCYQSLNDRFILCAKCDLCICCSCFASGVEFDSHKNDHPYRVMRYDFPLYEHSDWTAQEELLLLDGLLSLGNYKNISKKLTNRTPDDIKSHYEYFYLLKKGHSSLPEISSHENSEFINPAVPFRFRVVDIEEPPRYAATSASYHSVAGYNAARSDFELDYDMNAEDLIANLDFVDSDDPNYQILTDLQCALIQIYNWRLRERLRRRKIIRNHGLILLRKITAWLHRYDSTITQPVYNRLTKFMQCHNGQDFEYLMEGLHRAGELKIHIARLCDFHKRGIKSLKEARLYLNLKQQREENMRDLKTFYANPIFNFKFRGLSSDGHHHHGVSQPAKKRGTFTPLDVIGMPGLEKLLPKERDLCRNCRLAPLSYLELKATLIGENNKLGYLKLLTARRLLKIDVNKTRRLYDFLVDEGYITKG
ncbi:transcriptional adapter 2-alpha-like isoform X1 [Onthophagus taurus]|uniref:transcriptional adapter 2-alpha-like isoform X1 n=1 Tax=Onthophagus taurus TaxID=166361 RepID=UPI000C20526C|nr:transcriptional adapter 2-alpha-like isoform X1 [Onthophagus taurus]